MGAGAVTLGLGAAMVSGAGVAHAESNDSDGASHSSERNADDSSGRQAKSDSSSQTSSASDDGKPTRLTRTSADSADDVSATASTVDRQPRKSSKSGDDDADEDSEHSDSEPEESTTNDDEPEPEIDSTPVEDTGSSVVETKTSALASPSRSMVHTTVSSTSSGITTGPASDTDTPVQASALLTLTGAARRDTVEIDTAAVTFADAPAGVVPGTATSANADSQAEADKEAADAQFNLTLGWIPGLGTVYNGLSLFSDVAEFSAALATGDSADILDEIGDMAVDVIGMVPVVGGPLAATIHQLRAAASGPPNDAPIAGEDIFITDEDQPLTGNVLTNDTDTEGAALIAAVKTQPTHGMVVVNADGSFAYTPTADYNGVDVFTYTVSDGAKNTTGTVTITVTPVSDAPVAGGDTATLDEDNPTVITLLDNDSDVDGDTLAVVDVTAAGHGAVTLGDDGTVTYTPVANYNGTDSFTYTVTDGQGGTSTATVTLTINPVADAPVAQADNFGVDQDKPLTGNVLGNDFDPDGDPLTVGLIGGPSHGSLTFNPDGSFTYNPAGGFHGGDSFSYSVTDSTGASAEATATITVNYVAPPQPPPVGGVIGNDYPVNLKNAALDALVDPWGFYNRECTSFVAWRMNSANQIAFTNNMRGGHWGNATEWAANAKRLGYEVNNTPAVGSIGWLASGHVAWVSKVEGSNVTIEEYNYGYTGQYKTRTVNASYFNSYLHVADLSGGGTSGGGGGGGATSGTKSGTARVVTLVNVRNDPSTNGPIVAQYQPGQTFNYDSWVIANGFQWVSYVSYSGVRRYVAEATTSGSVVYLNGAIFH